MPDTAKIAESIIRHHRLHEQPGGPSIYLLLCQGGRVTLRSQQTRAMNLAWALRDILRQRAPQVAVLGGGGAGITFAGAAAQLGAKVTLYEAHRLMHLQLGCWHRPLHPEIYTWPADTAYRPVSHLPLFGWTTGSAHQVAAQIVAKFWSLAQGRITVREGTRATLNNNCHIQVAGEPDKSFDVIVVATGFGVESGPVNVALNSYWRSDSLDQPFLGNACKEVVVSGSGDGGLIDLLRVCAPDTEQTPFLDNVLAETLQDRDLLDEIGGFENGKAKNSDRGELEKYYSQLLPTHYKSLERIDALLWERKRESTKVHWLFNTEHYFCAPALPINRFLVSRLLQCGKFDISLKRNTTVDSATLQHDGQIKLQLTVGKHRRDSICCNHAIFRWGAEKAKYTIGNEHETRHGLLCSVASSFVNPSETLLIALDEMIDKSHTECNHPQGWPDDPNFLAIASEAPKPPELYAEFVLAFSSPDDDDVSDKPMVFRIRVWLVGLSQNVAAHYDLHPETNKPITRTGIGKCQNQWLNTRNDYRIRVRTDDGREWDDYSVVKALKKGVASDPGKRIAIRKKRDNNFEDDGSMTIDDALSMLIEQTGRFRARLQRSDVQDRQ